MPFLAVLGSIAGYLARSFAIMLGFKAFLVTLFVLVLPTVLNNFFIETLQGLQALAPEISAPNVSFSFGQYVGLGAWLIQKMMIPETLSSTLTVWAVIFTLRFSPIRIMLGLV